MVKLNSNQILKLQDQYPSGSDLDQLAVCKAFSLFSDWEFYFLNQDPDDTDYIWAIVKGFEVETGSVSLKEINSIGHFIIDKSFKPTKAIEIWVQLINNK